jgi:hypothetical protein
MGKVSKGSADHEQDDGVCLDRYGTVDGYRINFVDIQEDMDLAPMLASLPDGHCTGPHWGYLSRAR